MFVRLETKIHIKCRLQFSTGFSKNKYQGFNNNRTQTTLLFDFQNLVYCEQSMSHFETKTMDDSAEGGLTRCSKPFP